MNEEQLQTYESAIQILKERNAKLQTGLASCAKLIRQQHLRIKNLEIDKEWKMHEQREFEEDNSQLTPFEVQKISNIL